MKLILPRSTKGSRQPWVDENDRRDTQIVDVIDGVDYARPAPVPCPLCGQLNRPRRFALATGMKIPVAECISCRLAYQTPQPSREAALAYTRWRRKLAGEQPVDPAAERARALERLEHVRALRPAAGRLLDFGGRSDAFVDACRAAGWDAVRIDYALEPGDHAARADDTTVPDTAECFDVITLWNVVALLHDPPAILRGLRRRLSERGMLVIATANYESWQRVVEGRQWAAYGFEHRFYFSPASLEAMTWRAGFRHFGLLDVEHSRPAVSQLLTRPPTAFGAWRAYLRARRAWPRHGDVAVIIGVARV